MHVVQVGPGLTLSAQGEDSHAGAAAHSLTEEVKQLLGRMAAWTHRPLDLYLAWQDNLTSAYHSLVPCDHAPRWQTVIHAAANN